MNCHQLYSESDNDFKWSERISVKNFDNVLKGYKTHGFNAQSYLDIQHST